MFVAIQVSLPQTANRTTALKAKLDTGAHGNILPTMFYRETYPHQVDNNGKFIPNALLPSNFVVTAYRGSQVKHHGTVTMPCTYEKESTLAPFYVTDIPGPAIISLPTSTDLNLLQFICAIQTRHPHTRSLRLKHLAAAPPRLQRMLLRLQPYDLVIRYQPGKSIEIADALYRLSPEEKEAIPGMNVQLCARHSPTIQ